MQDDLISRQAALDCFTATKLKKFDFILYAREEIKKLPSVKPQESKWIHMTTRSMTKEEREHYREWYDVDEAMIFDCELPEDGQEVLVSYGGYVCVDTFCKDDGCYFEGVDIDDVDAWMPLPTPYKAESEE